MGCDPRNTGFKSSVLHFSEPLGHLTGHEGVFPRVQGGALETPLETSGSGSPKVPCSIPLWIWSIHQYRVAEVLPVVTAERVYGTGVWSDIKIAFKDAFGGRSATGEHLIARMVLELRTELQEAGADVGAHAVLGFQLRIDAVGEGA